MNLKPNKRKLIVSLVVMLAWYFILIIIFNMAVVSCDCMPDGAGFENCTDYEYLSPLKDLCHCSCTPLSRVIFLYFYTLIGPFLIVYLILSMVEKRKV